MHEYLEKTTDPDVIIQCCSQGQNSKTKAKARAHKAKAWTFDVKDESKFKSQIL
jgi:hypothetical protein